MEEDKQILRLDFGSSPEKLREDYLDIYEGIQSDVISSTRFDESLDFSTTYLGRTNIIRTSTIKAEERSLYRKSVYGRKIIRWYRMSDIIGHRSKYLLYPSHMIYGVKLYTPY